MQGATRTAAQALGLAGVSALAVLLASGSVTLGQPGRSPAPEHRVDGGTLTSHRTWHHPPAECGAPHQGNPGYFSCVLRTDPDFRARLR